MLPPFQYETLPETYREDWLPITVGYPPVLMYRLASIPPEHYEAKRFELIKKRCEPSQRIINHDFEHGSEAFTSMHIEWHDMVVLFIEALHECIMQGPLPVECDEDEEFTRGAFATALATWEWPEGDFVLERQFGHVYTVMVIYDHPDWHDGLD